VVILNGWACPKSLWKEFINALGGLPCVVIDMDFSEGIGSDSHIDFLCRQVDEETLLIGWSLGGMLGVRLVAELKQRSENVADAWFFMAGPSFISRDYVPDAMSDEEFDHFEKSLVQKDAFIKLFTQLICKGSNSARSDIKAARKAFMDARFPDLKVLREGLILLKTLDLRDDFAILKGAVNFVFAENDCLLDVSVARYVSENFGSGKCFILPDMGHLPWLGQKNRVLELIASNGVAQ
jgi:pimeloyl-[acyl-carrier protein] methyl ester esterase